MKLVSYDRFRKAISFDSGVQQDAIEAALDRATVVIGADLRNPTFDQASFTDRFYVRSTGCLEFAGKSFRTRLALSRGFLSGSVTAAWSGTWEELDGSPIALGPSDMVVDPVMGGVQVVGPDLRDCYATMTYTAGFTQVQGTYQNVPEWLQSVAITQAIILLDQSNPSLRHENTSTAQAAIKELTNAYVTQLEGRMRYFPSAVMPM